MSLLVALHGDSGARPAHRLIMPASLTLIILSRRRPAELRRCLESLERCRGRERIEVLVGLNGEDALEDGTFLELAVRFPWVGWVSMERRAPGPARNLLAARASGDWFYFIDDDAFFPDDRFLERVWEKLSRARVLALGGPNLAPPDSTPFQRAADAFLSSLLGSGPASIRYRRTGGDRSLPGWCFTSSNLMLRRDVFEVERLRFPASRTAEETLLLHRLERNGGKTLYCPELFVYHERRSRLSAWFVQLFGYGVGRGQITRWEPGSFPPMILAPLALLASLIAGLAGSGLWLCPSLLYLIACLAEAGRAGLGARSPRVACWTALLFPTAHCAYVAGIFWGLIRSRECRA
ncbi:MAG: glycosyltransferase [Elusimicrobia bacterium]|nr:glycosyltransferase [Elusimicrobiota bacterium]